MQPDPLRGPKLKLERAKCHIRDTEAAVRKFILGYPYEIFTKVDGQTGEKHIKVRLPREPIPAKVEGGAADAIHNLRVSLDQLACCLAAHNGHPDSRSTYFPFGNDLQDFVSASTQRKVSRLTKAAQDIIAAQEPYRGGNDLLWSLHALDLMDKHRQLIPVQSTGSGVHFTGTTRQPMKLIANPRWSPIKNDMTIATMSRDAHPEGNFGITFSVAFADVNPARRSLLSSTILRLSSSAYW